MTRSDGSQRGWSNVNAGSDYTGDEVEFMLAMDRYKKTHRRPFPDCRDVLRVIRALGYRRVAGAGDGGGRDAGE